MADEATVTAGLAFNKAGVGAFWMGKASQKIDVAGSRCIVHTQVLSVALTDEQLYFGELQTAGLAFFENLSVTPGEIIRLHIGDGGTDFMELFPGEAFPVRLASINVWAVAAAGTPSIRYGVIEA
jgi:hypothetical protein